MSFSDYRIMVKMPGTLKIDHKKKKTCRYQMELVKERSHIYCKQQASRVMALGKLTEAHMMSQYLEL